ncbi:MAG: DUF202 domain-containing protein [Firmicutes bacterium]|nr:DUF202 domain-containing protein [Alicyclobacillaceae bacterium]MCL6497942.1 DUF202 domain-containing protein [Bacillota bacterium]
MEHRPDPRALLANERTFLAWLRTGIALMAFGFVASKFDLFLHLEAHRGRASGFLGLFLVGSGTGLVSAATLMYYRNRRSLLENRPLPQTGLPLAIGAGLGLVGLAVLWYLWRAL